ncbi:MAG: hypothetical protein ACPG5B_02205 [Chitinophagales bacterium]
MLVNPTLIKTLLRVIENDFQKIIGFLEREVKQELKAQKRVASGELLESIEGTTTVFLNDVLDELKVVSELKVLERYVYSDEKIPAKNVKYGGKKHMDSLIKWIRDKGVFNVKFGNEKSLAFLIFRKQKEKGISTFRRKYGFMSDTIKKNSAKIEVLASITLTEAFEDILFNNFCKEAQNIFHD